MTATHYTVAGREVAMPIEVRLARAGAATFLARADRARELLPGPEIEVVEVLPGRALLSIALIDYVDNDLGDYDEVSIAFFVRPRGERARLPVPYLGSWVDLVGNRLGTWIAHLPVNQSFTCEAGRAIWGFPKTVQQIALSRGSDRLTGTLDYDGARALTLSLPATGSRTLAPQTLTGYSYIEGVAHRFRFTSGAEGFGVRLGGAELSLGSGRIADELRALGLPRRALMTTWMDRMHATFGPPEKL